MESLKSLLKNPHTALIDVRSPMEFQQEHIQGAMNIPLEEVAGRIREIQALVGPVVLYCRSGNRSGMAVALLKQAGLKEVYNGGGIYDLQFHLN